MRREDIGSLLQAYDAELFDIAGINPSTFGEMIYWDGSDYASVATTSLGLDNYQSWTFAADSGSVTATSSSNLLITGGAGLSTAISGNNITISAAGTYNIPLTASTTNWNTAYDWGDHSLAGYMTGGSTT